MFKFGTPRCPECDGVAESILESVQVWAHLTEGDTPEFEGSSSSVLWETQELVESLREMPDGSKKTIVTLYCGRHEWESSMTRTTGGATPGKDELEQLFERIQSDLNNQLSPSLWRTVEHFTVYVRYFQRQPDKISPYWVLELGNFGPRQTPSRLPEGFFTNEPTWGTRLADLLERFEEFATSVRVPFNVTQITFGYGVEEILKARGYLPLPWEKSSFRFHGDLEPERIDGADVYTIEQFRDMCKAGVFNEYDGSGVYGTETLVSPRYRVWAERSEEAEEAGLTHVHWYNK